MKLVVVGPLFDHATCKKGGAGTGWESEDETALNFSHKTGPSTETQKPNQSKNIHAGGKLSTLLQ